MEIVPGIYQLKVPIPDNPLGNLNAYLVEGDKGWLMVDTGWNTRGAFGILANQMGRLGVGFDDLASIVVTHIHPDHYGLAGELKKLSKAKLALHRRGKEIIESRYIKFNYLLEEMGRWLKVNGVPDVELAELRGASLPAQEFVSFASPDVVLEHGDRISTGRFNFEVMYTPGHCPSHICLYEPERKLLFSGDHILPTITPNISLHVQSGENPLADYLDSLRAIRGLEVDLVLPAHEHVFQGLEDRIEQLIQHHEQRKAEIVDVIRDKAMTAYQITPHIPWKTMGVSWDELPSLDKRVAMLETLAHLELLRSEGRVEKVVKDGVVFYSA